MDVSGFNHYVVETTDPCWYTSSLHRGLGTVNETVQYLTNDGPEGGNQHDPLPGLRLRLPESA